MFTKKWLHFSSWMITGYQNFNSKTEICHFLGTIGVNAKVCATASKWKTFKKVQSYAMCQVETQDSSSDWWCYTRPLNFNYMFHSFVTLFLTKFARTRPQQLLSFNLYLFSFPGHMWTCLFVLQHDTVKRVFSILHKNNTTLFLLSQFPDRKSSIWGVMLL